MRRGISTTEFWITAFSIVGTAAACVAGIVGAPVAGVAVAVSAGAYAIPRGIAKARQGDIKGVLEEGKVVAGAVKGLKK